MVTLQELLREKELVNILLKLVKYRHTKGREKLKELLQQIDAIIDLQESINIEELKEK